MYLTNLTKSGDGAMKFPLSAPRTRTVKRAIALFIALPLGAVLFAQDQSPVGNPTAGKQAWSGGSLGGISLCWTCHGEQGQGGYGPDLAGRGLAFSQFKHAVRKPWGVMPAFGELELPDQIVADIAAYLASLPPVAEPGDWRTKVPVNAVAGQSMLISNGCGQCHGAGMTNNRSWLGGRVSDANFDLYAKAVYAHTDLFPGGRMGTFSKLRLSETSLQEMFKFVTQNLGLTIPISARIVPAESKGDNANYTVTISNRGLAGKGFVAEDVTISLALASGTKVESSTPGYQGVKRDPQTQVESAVWQIPRLAPGDEQVCTLAISAGNDQPDRLVASKQSVVRWRKPTLSDGSMKVAEDDGSLQAAIAFPAPANKGERTNGH
jgi:mono/diheme cytochrome c family protein